MPGGDKHTLMCPQLMSAVQVVAWTDRVEGCCADRCTHGYVPARFHTASPMSAVAHTPVHTQTPVGPFFPCGTVSLFCLMWSLFLVVEAQWPQKSQMLCEVDELSGGDGHRYCFCTVCLFLKMASLMIRKSSYSRVKELENIHHPHFLSYCLSLLFRTHARKFTELCPQY